MSRTDIITRTDIVTRSDITNPINIPISDEIEDVETTTTALYKNEAISEISSNQFVVQVVASVRTIDTSARSRPERIDGFALNEADGSYSITMSGV